MAKWTKQWFLAFSIPGIFILKDIGSGTSPLRNQQNLCAQPAKKVYIERNNIRLGPPHFSFPVKNQLKTSGDPVKNQWNRASASHQRIERGGQDSPKFSVTDINISVLLRFSTHKTVICKTDIVYL